MAAPTPTTTDFDPFSTPVDYFTINGQKSPGIAIIEKATIPSKWEERQGYGLSGAIAVYKGRALAYPTARLILCNSADFAAWHAWRPLVQRGPNGRFPKMLAISHPWFAMADIKSVGVVDCSEPVQDDNGIFTITLEFIEYRRMKIALAKPEATTPDKPADAIDQAIEKMTDQVMKLAAN